MPTSVIFDNTVRINLEYRNPSSAAIVILSIGQALAQELQSQHSF
jgi:hypothetical protein